MISVLIIDDNEDILEGISEFLKVKKINTIIFTDGIKALSYLKENKVNALLVDLSMPKINGIDIISKMRKIDSELPIIAMSGMEWKETMLQGAISAGANRTFSKSNSLNELWHIITSLLKK